MANQPTLLNDIEFLFTLKGAYKQSLMDKGHGRIEKRTIDVALGIEGHRPVNEFIDWPHIQQAFRITRVVQKGDKTTTQTAYVITRLTSEKLPLSKAACRNVVIALLRGTGAYNIAAETEPMPQNPRRSLLLFGGTLNDPGHC